VYVPTPLQAGVKQSEIEDCFDDTIKNLNLGGKTFHPDDKADSNLHFGKHILSQYVRDNAARVDFTGFAGVLDRITAAYKTMRRRAPKPRQPLVSAPQFEVHAVPGISWAPQRGDDRQARGFWMWRQRDDPLTKRTDLPKGSPPAHKTHTKYRTGVVCVDRVLLVFSKLLISHITKWFNSVPGRHILCSSTHITNAEVGELR
jgi:hypothetical protein